MPNHEKKHRKNANQLMWNARICGVFNENSSILVALLRISIALYSFSFDVRTSGQPEACATSKDWEPRGGELNV